MRKIMGVIAGFIALFVIVVGVEMLGPIFHPIPAGLDPADNAALAKWIATAPITAQAVIVAAWLLGALGGGWVAMRIALWAPAAWIVAAFDALMALATIFRFDHPLWMQIGAVVGPLLGGWLAIRLGSASLHAVEPIDSQGVAGADTGDV